MEDFIYITVILAEILLISLRFQVNENNFFAL